MFSKTLKMLTFYLKLIVVPLLLIIMYFKTEEEKYDKNKGYLKSKFLKLSEGRISTS